MTLKDRFWSKVRADGTGCFVWIAATDEWGYGRFCVGGRNAHAHRVAWGLVYEAPRAGLQVLHACDNPKCCNPHHLFLGTNADNVADKVSKGRQSSLPGEMNGGARLRNEDIAHIRTSNLDALSLAHSYGVTRTHIYDIRKRKVWKCLP